MRIEVTAADIARAKEALQDPRVLRSNYCPIAQAVIRTCPDVRDVSVYGPVDFIAVDGREKSYQLPDDALKFMGDFDNGLDPAPMEFEIEGMEC